MTCEDCGRSGTRGFDVFLRQYPKPNRIVCSNYYACAKRLERSGNGRPAKAKHA